MKLAVVGTGIAGNVAARELAREHDITVFEADNRIGGHTNTVEVDSPTGPLAVDTGFIVYNDVTYPNFIALLDELGVASQASDMSFSMQHHRTGLEYKGSTLNTLFAQRSNLLRPSFHRMIRDILRFNREAPALLDPSGLGPDLGDYLAEGRYGREFIDHFIVPMGAAIWSSTTEMMMRMPARFFVRFFHNHGLLQVKDRPVWRVIQGGSCRYVDALVAGHRDRIRLNAPVEWVRRHADHVMVKVAGTEAERFDGVFLACHSDQALRLLADPTPQEQQVLGAIAYQDNEAVLHTDARLMPRRRRAWAAWNYHLIERPGEPVAVTYNMNILQGLKADEVYCVTLNHSEAVDPERIIRTLHYSHPVFTPEAVAAQARHHDINGARRTWYCGAYWRYGFHEDGVVSALTALDHFSQQTGEPHAQRDLPRAS